MDSESLLVAFRDCSRAISFGEIGKCLRENGGISGFDPNEDQSACEHDHKRPSPKCLEPVPETEIMDGVILFAVTNDRAPFIA
jgi:hypothetical protein